MDSSGELEIFWHNGNSSHVWYKGSCLQKVPQDMPLLPPAMHLLLRVPIGNLA